MQRSAGRDAGSACQLPCWLLAASLVCCPSAQVRLRLRTAVLCCAQHRARLHAWQRAVRLAAGPDGLHRPKVNALAGPAAAPSHLHRRRGLLLPHRHAWGSREGGNQPRQATTHRSQGDEWPCGRWPAGAKPPASAPARQLTQGPPAPRAVCREADDSNPATGGAGARADKAPRGPGPGGAPPQCAEPAAACGRQSGGARPAGSGHSPEPATPPPPRPAGYQRTCHVEKGRCEKTRKHHRRHHHAPVHICLGNGGADFYNNGFDPQPRWIEFEDQLTYGYVRLHVNGSMLHMEAVNKGKRGAALGGVPAQAAPSTARAACAGTAGRCLRCARSLSRQPPVITFWCLPAQRAACLTSWCSRAPTTAANWQALPSQSCAAECRSCCRQSDRGRWCTAAVILEHLPFACHPACRPPILCYEGVLSERAPARLRARQACRASRLAPLLCCGGTQHRLGPHTPAPAPSALPFARCQTRPARSAAGQAPRTVALRLAMPDRSRSRSRDRRRKRSRSRHVRGGRMLWLWQTVRGCGADRPGGSRSAAAGAAPGAGAPCPSVWDAKHLAACRRTPRGRHRGDKDSRHRRSRSPARRARSPARSRRRSRSPAAPRRKHARSTSRRRRSTTPARHSPQPHEAVKVDAAVAEMEAKAAALRAEERRK